MNGAAVQLALPRIPSPTLIELARGAQEQLARGFVRAIRAACTKARAQRAPSAKHDDLLDPARVATEFVRARAAEIEKFERAYHQPRGSLVGAIWADVCARWTARKPLNILTILRRALRAATGALVKRSGKKGAQWTRYVSVSDFDSAPGALELIDTSDPLHSLIETDGALDAADAWLAEREPRRRHNGASERTQERNRAVERAELDAIERSAAKFAASAGRLV